MSAEHKNKYMKGLEDVVEAIRTDSSEGCLLHMLALTYEFDAEQLASFLFARPLFGSRRHLSPDLAEMARIRPLVFYDAAKSREAIALPPMLELHPWQSRAFGCHHSKAYLLVTERRVHLVLGSFNLTLQGLARNREVLGHFCWPAQKDVPPSDPGLLEGFIRFLAGCLGQHVHESASSALWNIIACLRRRQEKLAEEAGGRSLAPEQPQALVWSGYGRDGGRIGQSGLERLRALWDAWHPGREPDALFVVSPFFDQLAGKASKPAARHFLDAFPSLKRLVVAAGENVLPADKNYRPMLSKAHFDGFDGRELYAIPREAGTKEREDIKQRAEGIRIDESEELSRPLHAKVLVLASGGAGLVYAGSANFSRNAWTGRNQELGFACRTDAAGQVWEGALAGLFAEAGRSRYQELPERLQAATPKDADEEEEASSRYPGFVDYVSLEPEAQGGGVCFVLHPLQGHDGGWHGLLKRDYRVFWGDGQSGEGVLLDFAASGRSQTIGDGTWQALLLQRRSLAFEHKASGERFWVPYVYAGEFVERRESLLSLSSLDWLALYGASRTKVWDAGLGDADPDASGGGAEAELAPAQESGPDRTRNPVVAMQIWLNNFGRAEVLLKGRLDGILQDGQNTADRIEHLVAGFLRTLSRLVDGERDRDARGSDEAWTFKTGETLRLACRLARKCRGRPAEQALLEGAAREIGTKLCAEFRDKAPGRGSVLAQYLAFLGIEPGTDREDRKDKKTREDRP